MPWSTAPEYRWLTWAGDRTWVEAHAWRGDGLSLDQERRGEYERGYWACAGEEHHTSIDADNYDLDTTTRRCPACAAVVLRDAGLADA